MKTSLAALTLILVACGDQTTAPKSGETVAPEQLFKSQQCLICHGPGGRGTPGSGPDLRNIDEHWDVESLVRYLAKPKEYADNDARLLANRANYRMQMPNTNLDDKHMHSLAEWILALE